MKGYKTQATAVITAILLVLGAMGMNVDQAAALAFFEKFWQWITAGLVGLQGLVIWFRQLGKENEKDTG